MCDQTEVSYLEDDVVWVKIGSIWWPGVVKDLEKNDEGKEILASLKKKPIAAVKFFQEDNYEFVKNLDQIYHYNCRRKDEFIKKGLDKFRTGASHMKKFPSDVTTAESLTNGDVNIINDPKFYPEKKESYSEIFGSGKKKSKKDGDPSPKPRGRPPANVTTYRQITHQRFINKVLRGESDHKVKTLIQYNSSSDDGVSRNLYKCHICKFETSRINVIVAHHRLSHSMKNSINWTGSDSKLIRRKHVYKARKLKCKKLFEEAAKAGFVDSDEEEELRKKKSTKSKNLKEKIKSLESKSESSMTSSPRRKGKEDPVSGLDVKKKRFTDVLLADWDEDEEDDKKEVDGEDKKETDEDNAERKDESTSESVEQTEKPDSPKGRKNQNEKMSCFDFDEEEEGFIGMSNANTYGRKIPRVIPVKDKSELGMDLEIEELFKRRSESESEAQPEKTGSKGEQNEDEKKTSEAESNEVKETESKETPPPTKGPGRRRRSKASKEEEAKVNAEESLALRRARRPGSKKSYLNEVIETVVDEDTKSENEKKEAEKIETEDKPERKTTKEETGSSSRRKQDFKHHTLDSDREEIVYSEIVSNEQKTKAEPEKKRSKIQSRDRREQSEDLCAQIDSLLEETRPSNVPDISEGSNEKPEKLEELKSTSFSFDYVPNEQTGKRAAKGSKEIKSISRMFSDSLPNSESNSEMIEESQDVVQTADPKGSSEDKVPAEGQVKTLKFSTTNASGPQKRGSIVLSSTSAAGEATLPKVKVLPVVRQGNVGKDCIVLPTGKKSKGEESDSSFSDAEGSRPKNIKAIKVKSDSLPSSLITAGKLKGQTIIHQKGGKYVIVTQSPPLGRPKASTGKMQSGSKVVILTNQLGEQKIITASGLQQTKFKVEGQKLVTDSSGDKEVAASTSGGVVGQAQPVIKMVPDGKGGIMKQLTVSPKKVLLGGTKVLVSGSGSTFSAGNNVQKITLSSGGGVTRTTGGDFRLIENYKGSGKTVLIQGGSNTGSGVVLKSASGVPRQVTKVLQNPSQTVPTLKKKPKILMRASTSQGEFVMQPAESPTFVVKQKGTDGKYSAQKFIRTEIMNQPKATLSGTGTKAFFISGQSANKKGESFIITTNESVPGKVIRMRQKIKEVDVSSPKAQKVAPKNPEIFAISQNNLLLPSETPSEAETSQIVQIQEQSQQPVLQTQVIAMPGPVGADGNQTYVLVSVDENGVVQGVDNSVVAYDATAQPDSIFVNPTSTNNVLLINPQASEEVAPVFSTSSQDILAEALANTNVLEGSINNEMDSVVPSILLPPSIPSSVVQETSITLQKPIMTPLEMPTSVAPDTSGLEPPPLPPTPTEEDVLMEESDMSAGVVQEQQQKEGETGSTNALQTYLESGSYDPVKSSETSFQLTDFPKEEEDQKIFEGGEEEKKIIEYYQSDRLNDSASVQEEHKDHSQEYLLENSQGQTNSFQSLPVLNDEPDTSDDVQGTESIPEQPFEGDKSRTEPGQFSQLLREQEPPSSTNNEMAESHRESKFDGPKYENYHQSFETGNGDHEPITKITEITKGKEPEIRIGEEQCEVPKEKDTLGSKENQSLPVIADESNLNSYDMDPIYTDVMSQKRFQEETEVTSTTDEFSNKEGAN